MTVSTVPGTDELYTRPCKVWNEMITTEGCGLVGSMRASILALICASSAAHAGPWCFVDALGCCAGDETTPSTCIPTSTQRERDRERDHEKRSDKRTDRTHGSDGDGDSGGGDACDMGGFSCYLRNGHCDEKVRRKRSFPVSPAIPACVAMSCMLPDRRPDTTSPS